MGFGHDPYISRHSYILVPMRTLTIAYLGPFGELLRSIRDAPRLLWCTGPSRSLKFASDDELEKALSCGKLPLSEASTSPTNVTCIDFRPPSRYFSKCSNLVPVWVVDDNPSAGNSQPKKNHIEAPWYLCTWTWMILPEGRTLVAQAHRNADGRETWALGPASVTEAQLGPSGHFYTYNCYPISQKRPWRRAPLTSN